jgi:hypothetical protein
VLLPQSLREVLLKLDCITLGPQLCRLHHLSELDFRLRVHRHKTDRNLNEVFRQIPDNSLHNANCLLISEVALAVPEDGDESRTPLHRAVERFLRRSVAGDFPIGH